MAYIIENANILKNNELEQCSLLIKNNRIVQKRQSFHHFRYMKMDASQYIMTNGHTIFVEKIPQFENFKKAERYFKNSFILKGVTTIVTEVKVNYESELITNIKDCEKNLKYSPIDYVIVVKIPLRLLTASFIRKCKREKIPALIVEIADNCNLEEAPWGWIREAMFPYFPLLIPSFKNNNRETISTWYKLTNYKKIRTTKGKFENMAQVPTSLLKETGIYYKLRKLLTGGEVSYNLYGKERISDIVDESELFHYYSNRLLITVNKGYVIRAHNKVFMRHNLGKRLKINVAAYIT